MSCMEETRPCALDLTRQQVAELMLKVDRLEKQVARTVGLLSQVETLRERLDRASTAFRDMEKRLAALEANAVSDAG